MFIKTARGLGPQAFGPLWLVCPLQPSAPAERTAGWVTSDIENESDDQLKVMTSSHLDLSPVCVAPGYNTSH